MNRPLEPVVPSLRLDTGLDVLATWADRATHEDKNAVYAALFAMTERTLLRSYRVLEDDHELSEFFVLLHEGPVLKIRVHSHESFGVTYVGPAATAPGMPRNYGQDKGMAA